jgi:hypothetical protein
MDLELPGLVGKVGGTAVRAARLVPVAAGEAGMTRIYAEAFTKKFSEVPALKSMWESAAEGSANTSAGYRQTAERFWTEVNTGTSSDSAVAREMLEAAGYDLQGGSRAPLLKLQGWDSRATRELTDRRLSIDHIEAFSKNPSAANSSSNMRFMTQRDNSFRGVGVVDQ